MYKNAQMDPILQEKQKLDNPQFISSLSHFCKAQETSQKLTSTCQNCELISGGSCLQCLSTETRGMFIVHTLPTIFKTKI